MNKIIYVQSNEAIAKSFKERFLENDIEMRTASSGEEALNAIEEEGVLLLLIDINLPDMRLRKLVDRIRERRPQTILNVCVDVLDPLMITKLSNRHHIHKIYVAPWDVDTIIEDVKESLEIAVINEETNVKEEQITSEKRELEETLESLKNTLRKQQHSYKKLSGLMDCFTNPLADKTEDDEELSRRMELAKEVCNTLLKMQTTGTFDVDKFEEDLRRDLREIKGKAYGFKCGEISSCLFGEQSRPQTQNVRFCIYVLSRLYAEYYNTFTVNVSSHFLTTKEAEFCVNFEIAEKINEQLREKHKDYFDYVEGMISDMTLDYRCSIDENTISYFMRFSVGK